MNNSFATLHWGLIHILSWFVATRRGRVIHLLSLPWLALLAWLTSVAWFLTDDAFISFRYVRNLLEGHGLVFNPGEYVEGYTNFLWILELAALWGLFGVRPEHAAPWLSVAYTGGTLAALWWWLARSPSCHDRGFLAWLALGLLGSSATFAVWTAGGGLETRQFTCFVVVAVVCLGVHSHNRWGLLAASLSLAAAALTRPEGLLLAACCFGWFAVQSIVRAPRTAESSLPGADDTILRMLAAVVRRLDWRELTYLIAPFAILVTAHFLFRYGYYGEWLPNTYYAKHVRPWYESGFRYLWAAALETGLYLLLPLAWVALRARWREHRDGASVLVLLLVGSHMAYVLRIGGDHFEYRPLDFYWPLLALPAAEGIAHLGAGIAASLQRVQWLPWRLGPRAWAVALFVPVLCYASAIQGALLFAPAAPHTELEAENAGWLLALPGMPVLVAISNDLRRQSSDRYVGGRPALHRAVTNGILRGSRPYGPAARGIIPDDAVMTALAMGIMPYYAPDLTFIGTYGLTDATVARNPVTHPNRARYMGHDRQPPPGIPPTAWRQLSSPRGSHQRIWRPRRRELRAAGRSRAVDAFRRRRPSVGQRAVCRSQPAGQEPLLADRPGRQPFPRRQSSLRWGTVPGALRGGDGRLARRRRGRYQPPPACVLCGPRPDFRSRRSRLSDQLSPRRGRQDNRQGALTGVHRLGQPPSCLPNR